MPEQRCLNCGVKLDTLGTGDRNVPARPAPGDVTACIKCGAVMILDENLKLRGFTDQEAEDLRKDAGTMNALAGIVRRIYILKHMTG